MSGQADGISGQDEAGVGFDIIDLWQIIVRRRWLLLAMTLLGGLLGYLSILMSTPAYVAEATLLPTVREANPARGLGGLASVTGLAGLKSGMPRETSEALAILESRGFSNRFFKDQKALPVLLAEQWDARSGQWKPRQRSFAGRMADGLGLAQPRRSDLEGPNIELALDRLKRARSVSVDQETNVVTLAIEWRDPVVAANWATAMVRLINAEMREKAIRESRNRVAYLQAELSRTQIADIRDQLNGMVGAELQKAMIANVDRDYAFRVIDLPAAPEQSVKPRRLVLLVLGLLSGLLAGLAMALIGEYLSSLKMLRDSRSTRHGH